MCLAILMLGDDSFWLLGNSTSFEEFRQEEAKNLSFSPKRFHFFIKIFTVSGNYDNIG